MCAKSATTFGMVLATLEEPGHYYVSDARGRVRIIEIADGRIYDGREMLGDLCRYELIGPVPSVGELESLTNACSDHAKGAA